VQEESRLREANKQPVFSCRRGSIAEQNARKRLTERGALFRQSNVWKSTNTDYVAKPPPVECDLSQVMAHAPALSQALGPGRATLVLLFRLAKTRRGSVGIMAALGIVGTFLYNSYLK
jgi:hypothetical protein